MGIEAFAKLRRVLAGQGIYYNATDEEVCAAFWSAPSDWPVQDKSERAIDVVMGSM